MGLSLLFNGFEFSGEAVWNGAWKKKSFTTCPSSLSRKLADRTSVARDDDTRQQNQTPTTRINNGRELHDDDGAQEIACALCTYIHTP
jgi:hypothetical protein